MATLSAMLDQRDPGCLLFNFGGDVHEKLAKDAP